MEFGVFFELSVPRPFTRENESAAYFDALAQATLADELGFDNAWVVEHHFLEEYSHSSAPELFLAALAMQTERIRLCHGAVVCVPGVNHPVRIAERAAALDILSKGRLELGTARSSTWTELGGFCNEPDITKVSWDEYVQAIPRMWTQDSFSFDGVSFRMPARNVLPKPVQVPHPPMWVAVTSPGTELEAAKRGLGCLGVSAQSFAAQERTVEKYREVIANCDPVGELVTDKVHSMNYLFCHEDIGYASQVGRNFINRFSFLNTNQLWSREVFPSSAYRSLGNLAPGNSPARTDPAKSTADEDPAKVKPLPEGVTIGDPEHIIGAIKKWESAGVDGINFLLSCVDAIPHEEVLESLRLFAKEVMPAFGKGRDDLKAGVKLEVA